MSVQHMCALCLCQEKASDPLDWFSTVVANRWVLAGSSGNQQVALTVGTLHGIHLLVSDVTRVVDPREFVEPLVAAGAQLQSHMEAVIHLLDRNTTEIPVLMVKWLLGKKRFVS